MAWRRLLLLGVALALVAIVPLAHASPPDPTWVPGLYDDDDFDDVVVAVTQQQAALDASTIPLPPVHRVVFLAAPVAPDTPDAPMPATTFPRAPPPLVIIPVATF